MAPSKEPKVKWGMVIDLDRCTGCGACMVSCQVENNLPPAPEHSSKLRATNWMMVYEISNQKPFPNHDIAYMPRPCQQCGNPPCVSVCPVIATDKNVDGGIVSQVHPRCIGCRYCMAGCPFGARSFNFRDPRDFIPEINPTFPTRMRGVVEKCTFCSELLAVGEMPLCVNASNGAIAFGDLTDPESSVRKLLAENFTLRRKPTLGTEPSVYYII